MASGKAKAVAVVAIGVGAIAAIALSGGKAQAEEIPAIKPKKKAASLSRVTLANKYANLFGVPTSLVLATIAVQSGNKVNAYRANKRGGAWGYGQMTLTTAQDIKKLTKNLAVRKYWASWDGTGKGLLNPEINIAFTAFYLSQWWKRYRQHRLAWILAAYAYALGPGRVKRVLPDVKAGKLPSPLPSNFNAVKTRYQKVMQSDASVRQAIAAEKTKPATSGIGATLYGKALAKTIPSTTTGYRARMMFGQMTQSLANAYGTLQNYDPNRIAQTTKLDAGSVKAARDYLDSTNAMLAKYYPFMPESNSTLTADQLTKLKACVSSASVAIKTVDDLFGTSWWKEVSIEVVAAGKEMAKKVKEEFGPTAIVAVAGIIGVGILVMAIKK
jgi:hypothetical protein